VNQTTTQPLKWWGGKHDLAKTVIELAVLATTITLPNERTNDL
jgi:hypothetical protein